MSVPDTVWLYPVRFSATSYAIRVTCNGVTSTLTFPASGSITVGRDYWVSGDGQTGTESTGDGRADLVAMLQATLRTHAQCASAVATYNTSTNKVRIDSGGVNLLKILWSDGATTLDPTIFGWVSGVDTSYLAVQEATNYAKGTVLFGRPVAVDSRLYQPITGGVAESLSGLVRVSRLATPSKRRDFGFRFLLSSAALIEYASGAGTQSVEYAWTNALASGYPFRHFAQVADVTTPTYGLYRIRDLTYPLKRNDTHSVWWDADFKASLVVSV